MIGHHYIAKSFDKYATLVNLKQGWKYKIIVGIKYIYSNGIFLPQSTKIKTNIYRN